MMVYKPTKDFRSFVDMFSRLDAIPACLSLFYQKNRLTLANT